mgnify:CR=1 FL=1
MSKFLIEIKKLSKRFENNNSVINVLKDINLNLESGKVIAIVGPSGSGKSTFLHLLALLDKPTKGKISIFGNSTSNITENKKNQIIRDYVSIIFQNNNLLSDFTALENVAIPLIIRNKSYSFAINKAEKFLKKVNLSHRLNHFPSDLSGGEQQRVAIARALINNPELIIADEMTGNLDEKTADNVFEFFLEKISSNNQTLIYVTHNQKYAKKANTAFEISNNQIHKI